MPKISDLFNKLPDEKPAIEELYIPVGKPVDVVFPTDTFEEVKLHKGDDVSLAKYFRCPGEGCPLDLLGEEPTSYYLLPVYDAIKKRVKYLRMTTKRDTGSLLTVVGFAVSEPHNHGKMFCIKQEQQYQYTGKVLETSPFVDYGEAVIGAFSDDYKEGMLAALYPTYTPEFLRTVPTIKTRLMNHGLYVPPADDGEPAF